MCEHLADDDISERRTPEQLRAASVPHAKWQMILEDRGGADPEFLTALDAYLHGFVAPEGKRGCVCCGAPQGGMLGCFRWGLAHGHGACSRCGWPAVAHHYIKDKDGEELCTLRGMILQFHPDFVERQR